MSEELEIKSLEELNTNTLYHVSFPETQDTETINRFAARARQLDLKVFISIGEFKFDRMKNIFEKLPEEQREVIRDLLFKEKEQEIESFPFGKPTQTMQEFIVKNASKITNNGDGTETAEFKV